MLSETDVHYLTGYLYVTSGENLVSVTLGEKVFDEKAGTLRDVDVAIVTAGEIGVIAAEVKDHKRKLDVTRVEQLCRKLQDMPDVTTRAIVSGSGFTRPAIRKAAGHDVKCLHLVRGARPRLSSIDISHLSELTVRTSCWADGPHVTIAPTLELSDQQRRSIGPETQVELDDETTITLKELGDRIARQFDLTSIIFEDGQDEAIIDLTLPFDQPPHIRAQDRRLLARDARIRGKVSRETKLIPLDTACYLANETGEPFAAASIFELDGSLLALTVGAGDDILRMFQIPRDVRKGRPIRKRIFQNMP